MEIFLATRFVKLGAQSSAEDETTLLAYRTRRLKDQGTSGPVLSIRHGVEVHGMSHERSEQNQRREEKPSYIPNIAP